MNDKMSVKKKRYIAVMLLGLALNIGLYWVSHIFKMPMWLDTVGTAVTAVALEPAAGLVIGYATNLFESSAIYMSGTIVFFAITAAGRGYRRHVRGSSAGVAAAAMQL